MFNLIKKYILIGITCSTLILGGYGCVNTVSNDYHESNDKQWLTEQVEKGHLTQAEADAIWAKQQAAQKNVTETK